MAFLTWIGTAFQSLAGLVLPIVGKASGLRGLGRGLRLTLHIALVAAITVALYFLNVKTGLYHKIPGPLWLAKAWLSILFLLIYTLGLLGLWLYRLLIPPDVESDFPDIDIAWQEAREALAAAGINLAEGP